MEKFSLKREALPILILLIPVIYLVYLWPLVPATIPIHFNLEGEADGWGSKWTLLLFPGIALFVYVLTYFLPFIDPKLMDKPFLVENLFKIRVVIIAFMCLMSIVEIESCVKGELALSGRWFSALILLMFIVLGNFMVNIKPNWFIGIRTPWTLSSNTVWRKTHQVGGKLWFYGGIICLVLTLLLDVKQGSVVMGAFVIGTSLFAIVYSYWLYRQEKKLGSS